MTYALFGREEIIAKIKQIICHPVNNNNAIYIYGKSGIGKTELIKHILKECDYEYILYDASTMRNKNVLEDIANHASNYANVMSMFMKKKRQIAFIMDEIDGMNNGDKGGINTLIKLIRQKKPVKLSKKKQASASASATTVEQSGGRKGTSSLSGKNNTSDVIYNPIICISNYKSDKKIKELMKICNVFELPAPTIPQIEDILKPYWAESATLPSYIIDYIQCDLRKMNTIIRLKTSAPELLAPDTFESYFQEKIYNDNTKKTTAKLLTTPLHISSHNAVINETDRTSVGLLWHENIIDNLGHITDLNSRTQAYIEQLNNICLADYIDRITFQKQIWQFNEMSSLIKTMKNTKALATTRAHLSETDVNNLNMRTLAADIRFTKVLTKYSTEYNNFLFIQRLCQQLNMDKKDIYGFFLTIEKHNDPHLLDKLTEHGIKKLDILRIQRFLTNIIGAADIDMSDEIIIDEFDTDNDDDICADDSEIYN